jgi:hypothetical protein
MSGNRWDVTNHWRGRVGVDDSQLDENLVHPQHPRVSSVPMDNILYRDTREKKIRWQSRV